MTKKIFAIHILLALASSPVLAEDDPLAKPNDKLSYSIGLLMGESLKAQSSEINYELLFDALKSQHSGGGTIITVQEANEWLQDYMQKLVQEQAAAAREEGVKYLADNIKRDGVKTTDSGLQYEVLTAAEGDKPKAEDNVKVHYTGKLIDGTVFDSSKERDAPATFQLNRVIPGWTEGVQLMSKGSKYRFVIPSKLAYGERGAGASIPPHSTLIFEVELLDINPEN